MVIGELYFLITIRWPPGTQFRRQYLRRLKIACDMTLVILPFPN